MIKKCIASILIILIFINSIGCSSYNAVRKDDINLIEEGGKIRLTMVDNKEYILKNVMVEDSIISGNQWVPNIYLEKRSEFSVDQVSKIEVEI